ncbi:hypothetical protein LXL04_034706 [Taraxacum kok-saghyz]
MHVTACPTMLWSTGGRTMGGGGGGWMVVGGGGAGATGGGGGGGWGLGVVSSLRGRPRLRFTGSSDSDTLFPFSQELCEKQYNNNRKHKVVPHIPSYTFNVQLLVCMLPANGMSPTIYQYLEYSDTLFPFSQELCEKQYNNNCKHKVVPHIPSYTFNVQLLVCMLPANAIIGFCLWSKSVRFVTTALLTGKSKSLDRDSSSYSSLGSAATICSLLRGRGSAIVGHPQFFGSAITLSAGQQDQPTTYDPSHIQGEHAKLQISKILLPWGECYEHPDVKSMCDLITSGYTVIYNSNNTFTNRLTLKELPNPESKSQIAANSSSLLLHRSRPSLRPFVASSSNHAFSGSALQAFNGSALHAIHSSQLLHRSRIQPVSPFSQPVQATTIASSHSEFMDSNTLFGEPSTATAVRKTAKFGKLSSATAVRKTVKFGKFSSASASFKKHYDFRTHLANISCSASAPLANMSCSATALRT